MQKKETRISAVSIAKRLTYITSLEFEYFKNLSDKFKVLNLKTKKRKHLVLNVLLYCSNVFLFFSFVLFSQTNNTGGSGAKLALLWPKYSTLL